MVSSIPPPWLSSSVSIACRLACSLLWMINTRDFVTPRSASNNHPGTERPAGTVSILNMELFTSGRIVITFTAGVLPRSRWLLNTRT